MLQSKIQSNLYFQLFEPKTRPSKTGTVHFGSVNFDRRLMGTLKPRNTEFISAFIFKMYFGFCRWRHWFLKVDPSNRFRYYILLPYLCAKLKQNAPIWSVSDGSTVRERCADISTLCHWEPTFLCVGFCPFRFAFVWYSFQKQKKKNVLGCDPFPGCFLDLKIAGKWYLCVNLPNPEIPKEISSRLSFFILLSKEIDIFRQRSPTPIFGCKMGRVSFDMIPMR